MGHKKSAGTKIRRKNCLRFPLPLCSWGFAFLLRHRNPAGWNSLHRRAGSAAPGIVQARDARTWLHRRQERIFRIPLCRRQLRSLAGSRRRSGKKKVDVIVTTSSISAQAARKVTSTVPIVMTSGGVIEFGLAESLAKPGGNVTGLTVLAPDLSGKRVELLKEAFPKSRRVAALWSKVSLGFRETQDAAKALSVPLYPIELRQADDIDKAFADMSKAHVDALLVVPSPLVTLHSKRIAELALKHRLPGMYPTRQFAEEGGIAAYGPLLSDLYRRAATYVDKILKGVNPADLPIEQPMKFEFIINLKAAKQIGVTIPPNVLARADKVIK